MTPAAIQAGLAFPFTIRHDRGANPTRTLDWVRTKFMQGIGRTPAKEWILEAMAHNPAYTSEIGHVSLILGRIPDSPADRMQFLSRDYRGKTVRVYSDPATRKQLTGIGIIRAIGFRLMDPPLFEARVQFDHGIELTIVHEEEVIINPSTK